MKTVNTGDEKLSLSEVNMDYYRFYDTDLYGIEEYDIIGEEYRRLIETCCKYSTVLALSMVNFGEEIIHFDELDKFKIRSVRHIIKINRAEVLNKEIVYYRVCPELCKILVNYVDSIFKWVHTSEFSNPEDLTFFREDGTVFFSSCIHEGVLTLCPQNEDVSEILKNPLWINSKNDERWKTFGYVETSIDETDFLEEMTFGKSRDEDCLK